MLIAIQCGREYAIILSLYLFISGLVWSGLVTVEQYHWEMVSSFPDSSCRSLSCSGLVGSENILNSSFCDELEETAVGGQLNVPVSGGLRTTPSTETKPSLTTLLVPEHEL